MPQTHQPDHFLIDREKKNQEKPKVTAYTYICINRLYIKKSFQTDPVIIIKRFEEESAGRLRH